MTIINEAAKQLLEAAARARRDALVNLEAERIDCRALIRKYDKARERLARLDAEYARVEAQKIEDIARQALERAQKCDGDHIGPICTDKQCWLRDPEEAEAEKPEPYRAGLPPERLRKVCSKWDVQERGGPADLPLELSQDGRLCKWADGKEWFAVIETSAIWDGRTFRPHGATWARVEAMADEAENPTLLDLTKLPVGTVCEATGQIARGSHVILPGERFAFAGSSTELLARVRVFGRDESFDVPTVVYARVVEEGGEQ